MTDPRSIPERLIAVFIDRLATRMRAEVINEVLHFVEHNECGLAYDSLVFEIESGHLVPSAEELDQVRTIARSMNIEYPKLSTDK